MQIKIKLHLSIGYAGINRQDEQIIEVADNATDKEIDKECEQIAEEWASNFIENTFSWEKIEANE